MFKVIKKQCLHYIVCPPESTDNGEREETDTFIIISFSWKPENHFINQFVHEQDKMWETEMCPNV